MKKLLAIVLIVAAISVMISCEHEHDFGEWQITKQATCTEEGLRVRSCNNCEEKISIVIDTLDHSFGEWKTTTPSTCERSGLDERVCINCGIKDTRKKSLSPCLQCFSNGHCTVCHKKVVNLTLTKTSLKREAYFGTFEITLLKWEVVAGDRYESFTVRVHYSVEVENNGYRDHFEYPFTCDLYDSAGNIVKRPSTLAYIILSNSSESTGYFEISGIKPNETYYLDFFQY